MPTSFVRVSTKFGEFSCSESYAKSKSLRVIDKPASRAGRALPPKPRVPKAPALITYVVPPADSTTTSSQDTEGGNSSSNQEEPA